VRAVDTNLLTRFFRHDDARQSPAARRVLTEEAVFVPKTVVVEFEWVMRDVYEHSRADIARCLTIIANMRNITLEDEDQVTAALGHYRQGVDFADALHLAASANCESFATFDNGLARRATRLKLRPAVTVPRE
jgi:predicted nucleic-acid-binding protein